MTDKEIIERLEMALLSILILVPWKDVDGIEREARGALKCLS